MTKYPRVGERYKTNNQPQGLCIICQQNKADAKVTVEVNRFRGDDFVYKIHWDCIKRIKDTELLDLIVRQWA